MTRSAFTRFALRSATVLAAWATWLQRPAAGR